MSLSAFAPDIHVLTELNFPLFIVSIMTEDINTQFASIKLAKLVSLWFPLLRGTSADNGFDSCRGL